MKLKIIGVIILFFVALFILQYAGLQWTRFFKPRYQNVERQVFEETKSYSHGLIQDLAKYYKEYNEAATDADRETIKNVVRIRFAEFDANKVKSSKLRSFLIKCRGY